MTVYLFPHCTATCTITGVADLAGVGPDSGGVCPDPGGVGQDSGGVCPDQSEVGRIEVELVRIQVKVDLDTGGVYPDSREVYPDPTHEKKPNQDNLN